MNVSHHHVRPHWLRLAILLALLATIALFLPGAWRQAQARQAPEEDPVQLGSYELIGWNDLGMHCMDPDFAIFSLLPPYNTLWAQVIYHPTGGEPQVITDGVTVAYSFVDNTYSAGKTNFWDYAQGLFGIPLAPDVGLTGAGMSGEMDAQGDHFEVVGVPLTPYTDSEPTVRQPYQLAQLVARDDTTGEILAQTLAVAPVSDEMRCDNCHFDGGVGGVATGNYRTNILQYHDDESGTTLMNSQPVLCAGCHASPALGTLPQPGIRYLSHSMHSKHAPEDALAADQWFGEIAEAQLLPGGALRVANPWRDGTEDCYQCHPGVETACLRDVMSTGGMWCSDCHGNMDDVGNENRMPWVDEPRCGDSACHGPVYAENPDTLYRNSIGHGGLYCEACHNSTHAIVPSQEPRDNLQNIALQGYAGTLQECTVCHGLAVPAGPGPHGTTCSLSADVDGDGDVDVNDIQATAVNWLVEPVDPVYDQDRDGDVDIRDIMLVARSFGAQCLS